MQKAYSNLLLFFVLKFGLMYLMRAWIRQNLREMERQGVVLPIVPK